MIEIKMIDVAGTFAENKDTAKEIRMNTLVPALEKNQDIILDFKDVTGATQSFIHALISDLIRKYGPKVLDRISFKNCNETIKKIIGIVIEYMQES